MCATSTSAPRSSRRRARAPRRHAAPPAARRHAARRPQGRGQRLAPPPVAGARARARDRGDPARAPARRPRSLERIAAAEPEVLVVCAYGVLIKEPLLLGLRDAQRASVAAAALARGGADRAGDHGRRRRDRRLDHAPDRRAGLGPGLPAGARADPPRRRLRHARGAAARRSAPSCSSARSTSARRSPSRTRRRHLRAQDRGRATARWTRRGRPRRSSARCARCARTSAPGCRCPTAGSSACSRRGSTARRARPPAAACAPTASACCWTATAARSS